jgi:excisionase family DNA binding protein
MLTVEQLAAKLQRPVGTIYYWVSRKEIPFEKHGRQLRFDYESVREHFRRKTEESRWSCPIAQTPIKPESCSLKIRVASRAESQKE